MIVKPNRQISIAPMLHYTDRHFRYLMRLIAPSAYLYTEMVVDQAILRGSKEHLLAFNEEEHPIAVQLGGSNPQTLAQCAIICEQLGYDEINLNVGCPSERVKSGSFGACLMAEPKLVAECVAAMQAHVKIPITVKTRIGIDQQDSYAFLCDFISNVHQAGCNIFIIHARKAWLKGLNPKQNRTLPSLDYERVYQLKKDFPQLEIIINGGIKTIATAKAHLQKVDGVMIGREAYDNPLFIADLESELLTQTSRPLPEILQKYILYMKQQLKAGVPLRLLARHLLAFYRGMPGAKGWRSHLSQHMHCKNAGIEVIDRAMEFMQ